MKSFDDITPEIAEVARSYDFREPPDIIVSAQNWLAMVLRWLIDFLESLHITLPGSADSKMVGALLQVLLYAAGFAAGMVLVAVALIRVRQIRNNKRQSSIRGSATESLLDSAGWKREAGRLAGASDWRGACRALYLSLLRNLDEKKVSPYAPTKTNYEYWYALARYPSLQLAFRQLADTVEAIWFGQKPAGPDDYSRCAEQLAAAEKEASCVSPVGEP
ncbi:MAG TPA: DUF4129 domain-containing protein [Candidatus Obscuribacterales bacterium]